MCCCLSPSATSTSSVRAPKLTPCSPPQFVNVPTTKDPDRVTMLEEEKVVGYYGGGTLYATPERAEPLL